MGSSLAISYGESEKTLLVNVFIRTRIFLDKFGNLVEAIESRSKAFNACNSCYAALQHISKGPIKALQELHRLRLHSFLPIADSQWLRLWKGPRARHFLKRRCHAHG